LFSYLQDLLDEIKTRILQDLADGAVGLLGVRSEDTGGVPAVRHAVSFERPSQDVDFAVRPLNDGLVLECDEIALTAPILHQRLEACAEGNEKVVLAPLDLLRRENADPAQARGDTSHLGPIREGAGLLDARNEGDLREALVAEDAMDDRLSLGDAVELAERNRIAVRYRTKAKVGEM